MLICQLSMQEREKGINAYRQGKGTGDWKRSRRISSKEIGEEKQDKEMGYIT